MGWRPQAGMLFRALMLTLPVALISCSDGSGGTVARQPSPPSTPKAQCGPGSRPETDIQGRVSAADHDAAGAANAAGRGAFASASASASTFASARPRDRHLADAGAVHVRIFAAAGCRQWLLAASGRRR